ncbi:MAG: hypothetical protein JW722_06140 [Demequinaceae bacterium]|nr:hypothetical protein [Demequinaceae bacterium]
MKARTTITVAAVLGLAAALVSCSDGGGAKDDRTFAFEDIEGFLPDADRFFYYDLWNASAGDAWAAGWPDPADEVVEPVECVVYIASVESVLESDESETASDEISFFRGAIAEAVLGDEGFAAVYVRIRRMDSPASADQFLADLRESATPCVDGYSYTYESVGYSLTSDSISISTADLPKADGVLKLDERNWAYEIIDDPESSGVFDHYTHYAVARGNLVFIASYAFDGGTVTDDDAAELIGQFIEHLG